MSYNGDIETAQFGDLLREAREKSGFDVETLARRLHIRGDIVRAIEDSNLSEMPASGYARNMIRTYARTVGLNQNEICNLYLDEVDKFERGRSREKRAQISEVNSKITGRRSTHRPTTLSTEPRNSRRRYSAVDDAEEVERSENSRPNRYSTSRPSRNSTRTSTRRSSRAVREAREDRKSLSENFPRSQKTTKSMSSSFSLGGLPKPSVPNINASNLAVAAIAIIIVVLIIVICVMLFGSGSSKSKTEDLPTMPISGLTDTSNKESDTSAQSTAQSAKTKATFTFSVADGEESYCEVYLDGTAQYTDVASGPVEKSFDVTGILDFITANPEPITIKLDGQEVQMEAEPDTGYYVYSYEFKSEDNANATSSTDTSASASTNNSTTTGTTTSGTTTTTQ